MKGKTKKSSGNFFKDVYGPLENEEEYEWALKRVEQIFSTKPGTAEGAELEALSELVEAYEDIHYPIPEPKVKVELELSPEVLDFFGRGKKGKKRIAKVLRNYVDDMRQSEAATEKKTILELHLTDQIITITLHLK